MRVTYDRLDTSRNGLVVIALVTFMAMVVITLISMDTRQESLQTTQAWITCLALDTPAIIPSGRRARNLGYANPAIDLRHSPHLPLIPFSPEDLINGRLKPDSGALPFED